MARFRYDCALRWSDLDAFGHVNNARFLTLFEEARAALMFTRAAGEGVGSFEDGIVIARHEIDYLRPVDYGTEPRLAASQPVVEIQLWVADIRAASFDLGYEMFDGGKLASRALSKLVPYDLELGRPRRLHSVEREFLERWVDRAD